MTKKLLDRLGHHYIVVVMILSRLFGATGGLLVIYYVEFSQRLPNAIRVHFWMTAAIVVVVACSLTVLIAMWETRALRKVLGQIRRGEEMDAAQGSAAGREAVAFMGRHHRIEAWFVPCSTLVPTLIVLRVLDDISVRMMGNITAAVFMGISMALMSTFFALDYFIQPVVRHLMDHGIRIEYTSLKVGRIRFRFALCFSLIILTTALMIGTLARQRAYDIYVDPSNQEEAVQNLIAHSTYITVAAVVTGLLFSTLLTTSVTSRVGKLVHAVDQVGRGNLGEQLRPTGNDEIDVLARRFNWMVEELDKRTSELRSEILQREAAQSELVRAKDAAEGANRAKSEFLANMSHEIRTPVNSIVGFAELLRGGVEDAVQRDDFLDTIHTSSEHLVYLINDILDISKVEAGQMEIELVHCSPPEIISEVISIMQVDAESRGLAIEYRWSRGTPDTVETDPARLRQLLMNLIGNAVKFTKRGGVQVDVQLVKQGGDSMLVIDIEDTGVGIAPEKLASIFDPFVQAYNSVTREFGGTGLGLAISHRIVAALGGTLTVKSELGKGTVFTATIKVGLIAGVPLREPTKTEVWTIPQKTDENTSSNLANARILLVEDGPSNRKLIRYMLDRAGAHVTTAENGKIGFDLATAETFDLILMDMQMPVMDGYTATTLLRQHGVTIPIIALTAHAMKYDRAKCEAAGCSDYLTKPVNMALLLRTLAETLGFCEPSMGEPPRKQVEKPTTCGQSEGPLVSSLPADDPVFQEVIEEFVESLAGKVQQMQQALKVQDLVELRTLAHTLKGTGGTVGFDAFYEPAQRLMELSENEQLDQIETAIQEIADMAGRIEIRSAESIGNKAAPHGGSYVG